MIADFEGLGGGWYSLSAWLKKEEIDDLIQQLQKLKAEQEGDCRFLSSNYEEEG